MAVRKHLTVFLASSGVQPERDRCPDIVDRVNRMLERDGLHLDLFRWETHAIPGLHPDGPQGLINPDLDKADIVVLLAHDRVGPGTREELERTLKRWEAQGAPKLLAYFSSRPLALDTEAALDDRREVLRARALLEKRGLVGRYSDVEDLARKLELDLMTTARAIGT